MKDPTKQQTRADAKQPVAIKNTANIRVFFALWPQAAIQRKLHTIGMQYQAKCNARLMRTETLHMTLQFIGNIKRSQLPILTRAADKVFGMSPFRLELNTLSFWKHNRIGYAACSTHIPALDKLVATLQQALAQENVIFDSSKFSPHITLLRNVEHIVPAQNFTPVTWQVNAFVLVESVTTHQKAEYRILEEWPLSAPITQ